MSLETAARVAESLALDLYESGDTDANDKMILDKYSEIIRDAGEMYKAIAWFEDQSDDNASLVEGVYHWLDVAHRGNSNEEFIEAATTVADMRDDAARKYAAHLINK